MVAISMYTGNLHRVSDIPRRWRMPERTLSLREFKYLLHRRKRALVRFFPLSNSNLNPSPRPDSVLLQEDAAKPGEGPASSAEQKSVEAKAVEISVNRVKEDESKRDDAGEVGGGSDGGGCSGKDTEVQVKRETEDGVREDGNSKVVEKPADAANDKVEVQVAADVPNETEKTMKEIEEKLQVLNAKKHNLVQVLKLILNAEEELKRRCNTQQGMIASRPSLPLQVDVSNDSGANTEGGGTEDAVTPNVQSRHMLRFSGFSPSSESPLRRAAFTQHNMVPHPSRASPRVTPSDHQAQPGNPPRAVSVSASGTNYIASSPSPAASGGTSVFRDSRLQSPWN